MHANDRVVECVRDALARAESPRLLRGRTRAELLEEAPGIASALCSGLPPHKLEELLPHLGTPRGVYYNSSIVEDLLNKKATPLSLLNLCGAELAAAPDPRLRIQGLYYNALEYHNDDLPPDKIRDPSHILLIAQRLELGVYNHVIHACSELGDSILRSWENPNYVSHYSARSATVYRHLDPFSDTVKYHGNEFVQQLLAGEIDPLDAGPMSASRLCPAGFEVEKNAIDRRKEQKVEKKVTGLWTCPGCKGRASTTRAVQDRAADEPTSVYATCTICHLEWKAA